MLSLFVHAPLLLLAQVPAVSGASGQASDYKPSPPEHRVEITALANEGFLLRSGTFKVLIDGFVKDPYQEYEALPPAVYQKLVSGEAPFDGYVLALVSHDHPDHFQPLVAERFLRGNPDSALIASPQVCDALARGAQDLRKIKQQIRSIPVKKGEPKIVAQQEMSVEMMTLAHGGEKNRGVVLNYGHLLTMGGFKLLHVGDADVDPEVFAPYHLETRDIDVAFVPYWFFTTPQGVKIVDEQIHAKHVIACHIPPAERELFLERMKLENPHVKVFAQPMERLVLDGTSDAPAADAAGAPAAEPPKR